MPSILNRHHIIVIFKKFIYLYKIYSDFWHFWRESSKSVGVSTRSKTSFFTVNAPALQAITYKLHIVVGNFLQKVLRHVNYRSMSTAHYYTDYSILLNTATFVWCVPNNIILPSILLLSFYIMFVCHGETITESRRGGFRAAQTKLPPKRKSM